MPIEFPSSDRAFRGPPQVFPAGLPGTRELDWRGMEGQPSMKYASLGFALSHSTPTVQSIVRTLMRHRLGGHKRTVIDIRWWPMLYPGQVCALLGWHTDVTPRDDAEGRPERHSMVAWGGSQTRFLRRDVTADSVRYSHDSGPTDPWFLPMNRAGEVIAYGRDHLHTAWVVEDPSPRLLIRMTETDLVDPRNRLQRAPLFEAETGRGHCQYGLYHRIKQDRNRGRRT